MGLSGRMGSDWSMDEGIIGQLNGAFLLVRSTTSHEVIGAGSSRGLPTKWRMKSGKRNE